MIGWMILLIAVSLESIAHVALKQTADDVDPHSRWRDRIRPMLRHSPRLILGIACLSSDIVFWTLALRWLPLSIAYPAGSLSFVGVALLSWAVLKESLGKRRWVGVAMILCGIALIAW